MSPGERIGSFAADPTSLLLYLVAAVPFAAVALLASRAALTLAAVGVALGAAYLLWSAYVVDRKPALERYFGVRGFLVAAVGCGLFAATRVHLVALDVVYLAAFVLVAFYYWVVGAGALASAGAEGPTVDDDALPSVSVLVPAYDEAGYIGETVRSVLETEYDPERLEVIVVDDGSTDDTAAEAAAVDSDLVRVVSKSNGGKHSALNYGLLFASNEVVVTVDADTTLESDSLRRLVAPFVDEPDLGGVAGTIRVANRSGLLGRCQALEYVVGINLKRRLFDRLGAVTIVPGCFGAFRREALETVSGYEPDTLTEDFDVTMKVLRAGYRVRASDAVATTEAPDDWRSLYRQRLRWYRGNLLTLVKHGDVLGESEAGYLHRLAYPLWLVESLFLPAAGVVVLGAVGWSLATGETAVVATLVAFLALVGVALALAVRLGDEDPRLLLVAPLLVVGYKTVVDLVLLRSLCDVVTGRYVTWTHPDRIRQTTEAATAEPSTTETSTAG
ncbi:glycosyltransferase [Halobium salinum]|uniref:Glycosyltransferase n=1 Tax=Halobium salinum TaxID=1364940 RepID=A0ABD5P728_9EURY|nr:glycosyltransferase family 2 protein [Halobium salinum]